MKIDLTCPVEIWRSELPAGDRSVCNVMLYNLSDTVVLSVEITMILLDADGGELMRSIHRARDLDGRPQTAFALSAPVDSDLKPASVDVIIEKVWFQSGIVWRRSKDGLLDYTSNHLPIGLPLEQLRFVAGKGAVGYPEEQEQVWLCVCGRPNALNESVCVRCHQSRQKVFAEFNPEAVTRANELRQQQLALQTKAVREENSRLQLEREKAYNIRRKRRRKIITAVAIIAVVLGSGFSVWKWGLPYYRYTMAVKTMEAGDLLKAREAFLAMPGYADADDRALACLYEAAVADMESEDVTRLEEAARTFRTIPDYKSAAENAKACDFRRAGLLMETDRPAAAALYTALAAEDYPGSADMVTQCAYLDACDLMAAGEYEWARSSFLAIPDWSDSTDRAAQCLYQPAAAALESGKYSDAITLLEQLDSGYADTALLLNKAYYGKGVTLCEDGELKEAGLAFLRCGQYEDAADQAYICLYTPAELAYSAGNWTEAASLYELVPDYKDSLDKFRSCCYKAAEEAVKDKEYDRARQLLEKLPSSYEDTLELRQQCMYQPALDALKAGDWETAITGFSALTTYSDGEERLKEARYGLAGVKAKDGLWADAAVLYEQAGDYKKAPEKLKEARYQLAEAMLNAGDPAGASELYLQLGDYEDSAEKAARCLYKQGEAAMAAGDDEQAAALFAAAGSYSDASLLRNQCVYRMARAAEDTGDTDRALSLYGELTGFEDAGARMGAILYAQGVKAEADGKILAAAGYFTQAGDTEDAAEKARACYDAYYSAAAEEAEQAMKDGRYSLAVTLLANMDLTSAKGTDYEKLSALLTQANYQEGVRLLTDDPYGALPYLEASIGYKDTDTLLNRNCFRLPGTWKAADGTEWTFRTDYTCSVGDQTYTFFVDGAKGIDVMMGDAGADRESLKRTYTVRSLKDSRLTLKDATVNFSRNVDLTLVSAALTLPSQPTPVPTETPTPTPVPTSTPSPVPTPADTPTPVPEVSPDSAATTPPASTVTPVPSETPRPEYLVVDDEEAKN